MGKFKIGDRVVATKTFADITAGKIYKVVEVDAHDDDMPVRVTDDVGDRYWLYAEQFVLTSAFTITTDKFYRTRSGKPTGRVSKGDTGFEAVVDGKVQIYDAAGGHVHGDADLDIVEAWVPRVGERVRRFKGHNPGSLVGHEAVVQEVEDISDYDPNGPWLKFEDGTSGYATSFEPLPVAAPQPAAPVLVIEAGKFYRTRDGRKVGPMRDDWSMESVYHYHVTEGILTGNLWSATGGGYMGQERDTDLIAEWQDTPSAPVAAQVDTLAEEYGPVVAASRPKFKVGDRVTVICNKTNGGDPIRQYALGGTYRITQIVNDLNGNDAVMLDNHHQYIKQGQFSPASTTAIVALIEDGQPKPAARPYVHTSEEAAATEAKRLAGIHKGKQFGVFVLTTTAEEAKPAYRHEWQRLAADGQKISAIKELRSLTGMMLKPAKDVVEHFIDYPYGQAA